MSAREALAAAGRVVSALDQIAKGATLYIVDADGHGKQVFVCHSGTFNQSAADLIVSTVGSYSGKLPTATFHGATQPTPVYPDSYGMQNRATQFFVISSVDKLSGVEFYDRRPEAEQAAHPLAF